MTTKPLTIPVITGPTASGKTALGCELFGKKNYLALSFDSMQVYRGMDIGSAKPTKNELSLLPHELIDCADPLGGWSVGQHLELANRVIDAARLKGQGLVIIGGTGLYLKALLNGFFKGPPKDPELRSELEALEAKAPGSLFKSLSRIDPETANRLSPKDLRRIIRALEVHNLTGESITRLQQASKPDSGLKFRLVGLILDRDELNQRIEERVEKMLAGGLIDEVKALVSRGCHAGLVAMQGVGYREILDYLSGELSLDEARQRCVANTKTLAQKQIMLFRRLPGLVWFNARDQERLRQHFSDLA